mgnify:FL=1
MAKKKTDVAGSMYAQFLPNAAKQRQGLYERMYERILAELAINRFEWKGMPDEIDTRFLEFTLCRNALSVFFHDEQYGRYFALQGSGSGRWNMYDNPIAFTVVGNGMISRQLAARDCVPIWGNALRTPDADIIAIYSTKLAQVERTIEINLNAARMPFLITVEEGQRLTMENLMRQVMEGQPAIFGSENMLQGKALAESIQLMNTGIDRDLVLNLQIAKSKMWNECMTLLGINNANQDKRERLVADEISANDSQISSVRAISLNARQQACDIINSKYALNVSCEWREDQIVSEPDVSGTTNSVDGV